MQHNNHTYLLGLLPSMLKALYQDTSTACYYFQKHLKPTAQCDMQVQAVSLAAWHLPCPQLSFDRALLTL